MTGDKDERERSIAEHYDRVADRYRHMKQSPERIIERIKPIPGTRILDVGCGTGNLTFEIVRALAPSVIVGIDISEAELRIANEIKTELGIDTVSFQRASATALPFEPESFDVVTSNMVFHLLDDQKTALSEALRVLKPGGVALLQFQGQREPAQEYFALLRDAWAEVLRERPFPRLFYRPSVGEIDEWMKALGVERFDVNWKGNTVYLNETQIAAFRDWIDLVSGYWRSGLAAVVVAEIEHRLDTLVEDHFRQSSRFRLTGSVVLLEMIKNTPGM